ncbi:MAG: hypothetical protein NT031_10475, partial [Planctomycetota bacterium]|nr:hypothetical protein [Planctomycetota bacterium]
MEESLDEATDDWAARTQRAKGPAPNASTDKPSAPYVYVYRGTGTAGAVATPPPPPSGPAQAKIPIVGDELKNPATT